MLRNLENDENKNFIIRLIMLIMTIIIVVWIYQPPKNKALQIAYWGHLFKSKIMQMNGSIGQNEYKIHLNNAIYIVNLYSKTSPKINNAVQEINLAFEKMPKNISENELNRLYSTRANVKFYTGDYNGAIEDFENVESLSYNDNLLLSMLYKRTARYDDALEICRILLDKDSRSYEGFACVATVKNSLGDTDAAINAMTFSIEQKKNNPRAYIDRAKYKKSNDDYAGYKEDLNKAKALDKNISETYSFESSIINPKTLSLPIKNF